MKNGTHKITHENLVALLLDMEARGGLKNTFIGYVSITSPKLNKKSRITGEPFPFQNVVKVTKSTARFGVNYSTAVENKAEKITGERVTFEAEKPKGMHFVKLPNGEFSRIILESDKEPGKYYARLTFSSNDKPYSVYLANGKEIEKSALVDYMPPKRENFIEVRSVTINNLATVRMNGGELILK